jgi:hypothetical protein
MHIFPPAHVTPTLKEKFQMKKTKDPTTSNSETQ